MKPGLATSLRGFLLRLLRDERRGELLEYVIVGGMISLIAIFLIAAVDAPVPTEWAPLDQPFD